MPIAGKTGIYETNPNTQTVKMGSRYINLSALSRATGYHSAHLSYIFSGGRKPSYESLHKISAALGMSLDDFSAALVERVAEVKKMKEKVIQMHLDRQAKEDAQDIADIRDGRTPMPRLPALRSA